MTLPPVILLIEYCSPAFHLLDKLINLKYEYNGYTGDERWAIITELSGKKALGEVSPCYRKIFSVCSSFHCTGRGN